MKENNKALVGEFSEISLIIFDFDGPLRSAPNSAIYHAFRAALAKAKVNHERFFTDEASFLLWHSHDWRKKWEEIQPGLSTNKTMRSEFDSHYNRNASLFPWVGGVLSSLAASGYDIVILSSNSRHRINGLLEENGHNAFVRHVLGREDVKNLKPHPEGIHILLERFKREPREAIIIGDNKEDILAGKSAGTYTGAVGWGCSSLDELKTHEPDFLFSEWTDFLRFIRNR